MNTATSEFKERVAIWLTIHCIVWAVFLLGFALVVPRYHRVFDDFGVSLPLMTMFVFLLSDGLRLYWYLLIPGYLILLLAIDGLILYGLESAGNRPVKLIWTWSVLILPILLAAASAMAILHTLWQLQSELA